VKRPRTLVNEQWRRAGLVWVSPPQLPTPASRNNEVCSNAGRNAGRLPQDAQRAGRALFGGGEAGGGITTISYLKGVPDNSQERSAAYPWLLSGTPFMALKHALGSDFHGPRVIAKSRLAVAMYRS
jgi:hypothetical protein